MIDRMLDKVDKTKFRNIVTFFGLSRLTKTPHGKKVSMDGFLNYPTKTNLNLLIWALNKRKLYQLFNQELKIEIPLKEIDYLNLIDSDSDFISEQVRSNLFGLDFIKENPILKYILSSTNSNSLLKNEFVSDIVINGNLTVKKGTKISKSFKTFIPDNAELRKAQDEYSEIIQSYGTKINRDKVLVLSIDPIDYITMSSSRSNWSSCHHPNKGYGLGSISYMNDTSTVIAYIKNSEDVSFSVVDNGVETEISYPTKEWRQIVLLNPDEKVAIQLREYPSASNIYSSKLSKAILDLFRDQADPGEVICSEKVHFDNFQMENDPAKFKIHRFIDYHGPWTYYCDVSNGNTDEGYITYSKTAIECQKLNYRYLFEVGFDVFYFDEEQTIVSPDLYDKINQNFLAIYRREEVCEDDD